MHEDYQDTIAKLNDLLEEKLERINKLEQVLAYLFFLSLLTTT